MESALSLILFDYVNGTAYSISWREFTLAYPLVAGLSPRMESR